MPTKLERIEARLSSDQRVKIERAAAMTGEDMSAFLVKAADQRADEVFASKATTFLPAAYFDDLLMALDKADPAPRLETAIARARRQA